MNLLNVLEILKNVLMSIPYATAFLFFAFISFGFKDKFAFKPVAIFVIILASFDVFSTINLNEFKFLQMPLYIIICTILALWIFRINLLSGLISFSITSIFFYLYGDFIFLPMVGFITKNNNIFLSIQESFVYPIVITLLFSGIIGIICFIMYKLNIKILDLQKYSWSSKLNDESYSNFNETVKILLIFTLPTIFFIGINFTIYYNNAIKNMPTTSYAFFAINSISIVFSNFVMFFLIKRIFLLSRYKADWNIQQKHLKNINTLLGNLKSQKHGFINHMNVILGLLTLKENDEAKKYLTNINNVISTTNNVVSVDNPTMSAILNSKSVIADQKGIEFNVNADDDLSQMSFNAFEISEVLGNIIDNAFDATSKQEVPKGHVKINITSDNEYYIFNIENTGETIKKEIITRIFDEGFTTKNYEDGDHGFGLYITKNIIESYKGNIEVVSQDNITSFKIYLPKVMENEFKAS